MRDLVEKRGGRSIFVARNKNTYRSRETLQKISATIKRSLNIENTARNAVASIVRGLYEESKCLETRIDPEIEQDHRPIAKTEVLDKIGQFLRASRYFPRSWIDLRCFCSQTKAPGLGKSIRSSIFGANPVISSLDRGNDRCSSRWIATPAISSSQETFFGLFAATW